MLASVAEQYIEYNGTKEEGWLQQESLKIMLIGLVVSKLLSFVFFPFSFSPALNLLQASWWLIETCQGILVK